MLFSVTYNMYSWIQYLCFNTASKLSMMLGGFGAFSLLQEHGFTKPNPKKEEEEEGKKTTYKCMDKQIKIYPTKRQGSHFAR